MNAKKHGIQVPTAEPKTMSSSSLKGLKGMTVGGTSKMLSRATKGGRTASGSMGHIGAMMSSRGR